jgi:cysteine desulfurase family protein (TIGR01976 family)
MNLDINQIRDQFPALDRSAVFLDNPGSLERIQAYLHENNANHGGAFATSQASDAIVHQARQAMADFLNAPGPETIIFGPNMTSLTFNISRSLARSWKPDDEVVVTRLDHDANITPWVMAANDHKCHVRWVDFHTQDGTLDLEDLEKALENHPRLLAVGYASNALGTVNPLSKIIPMAHAAGALVYVDAVQYAPHGPIDVQNLDCDFLVCSAYKFFGPHVGVLYGKYDLLDELTAYKVRPAPAYPPGKFETGTGNFEGYAGVLGATEYFEWLGETFGADFEEQFSADYSDRRLRFKQAMAAIRSYETSLSRAVLEHLATTPGVQVFGPKDIQKLEERVPTVSFTLKGWQPRRVAEKLAEKEIYVWDGNYYALAVTERLGLEENGGMVRVGPVHYNTVEEIVKLGEALGKIAASARKR